MHLHSAAPARVAVAPALPSARVVLAAALAALVTLQIAWPLTDGALRARLTIGIVLVFALACVLQAAITRGLPRAAVMLAVTAIPGFAVEVLGVRTGVPFGGYDYSDALGPQLLGVPLVVALAWTMMTWPAAVVARRLTSNPVGRVLLGAWAATAGDVFLDPQLVAIGGWTWVSWTVALAVFLAQPAAAAWGALAMGAVAVPLLVRLVNRPREARL